MVFVKKVQKNIVINKMNSKQLSSFIILQLFCTNKPGFERRISPVVWGKNSQTLSDDVCFLFYLLIVT
jgi:hypothetical protein